MTSIIQPIIKNGRTLLTNGAKELRQLISRPQSERKYIAELDGLRFIAILAVVVQHLSERLTRIQAPNIQQEWANNPLHFAISRGSIGVLLFFTISGFILSLPFWSTHTPIAYGAYLRRRLLRIEPPYLIWMSLMALVLYWSGRYASGDLGLHWLVSLAYLHTLGYGEFSVINPVAWSLEIEIQFYLLAPWLVYLLRRSFKPEPRFWIIPTLILAYTVWMHVMGWQQGLFKFTLLGQLPYFMVGIWIADQYQQGKIAERQSPWRLLILPLWLLLMYNWSEELPRTILFIAALSAFFSLALRPSIFRQLLRKPWIAAIGGMCYTIYLVHLPLLEGLSQVSKNWFVYPQYGVSMLIHSALWLTPVLVFSTIAYVFLEKPFMLRNWPHGLLKLLLPLRRASSRASITVFFIGGILFVGKASAQTDTLSWQGRALAPLPILIERALNNAIALKVTDRQIEIYALDRDISKRQWMQHISIVSGVDAGNGNYVSTNNDGLTAVNTALNRQAVQFVAGLNVRLPLSALVNRQAEVKKRTLTMEKEMLHKSEQAQLVREEVIVRYTQFKEALTLLGLQSAANEASALKLTAAEKYFKEAQLSVEDFGKAMEQHFQARMELEKRKSTVEMAYHLLDNIVGTSIH